jgi:hypothetical protein
MPHDQAGVHIAVFHDVQIDAATSSMIEFSG